MIKIGNRKVGNQHEPFVIAEMSANHRKSIDHALKVVDFAAAQGVDAIKIQTYKPDTMTLNLDKKDFLINDEKSLWNGRSLYDLYQEAHTPWEWHEAIFARAKKNKIMYFSTPFDRTAVDFLETFDVPCYKIASFENNDLDLIQYVASKGKPLIISTGMATLSELEDIVLNARQAGCTELALLKCNSNYPADSSNANLLTIPNLKSLFNCEVGLSDHSMGIGVSIASVALGATIIEKHFTLSRSDGGVDSSFSMEPNEMRNLVSESKKAWNAIGSVKYGPTESEINSLAFKRSIYIVKNIKKGDVLTTENLRVIRPGYGLSPKFFKNVLGMRINKKVEEGTPLSWDLMKETLI